MRRPRWVYEGQLLRIPLGLLCEVVCAAGTSARLVNKLHGVDGWYALDELSECDDERGDANRS